MHHPDICNILLIIDDYFLLMDGGDTKSQIEPIVDESDEYQPKRGVRISRKLLSGHLQADIWEMNEDDDTVTFRYSDSCCDDVHSIEIENCDYSRDEVREAVRTILKMDKHRTSK